MLASVKSHTRVRIKMKNLFKIIVSFYFGLMALSGSICAAQSNFQVTPPPIAAPEFEAGKVDVKAGLTFINMSGSGFNLEGAGANYIRRQAFTDEFAWDMQGGLFVLSGSLSGNAMTFTTVPLSLNVEYQPLKTSTSSLILFAGPNYSASWAKIKNAVVVFAGTPYDLSMNMQMYGWQGGGQYSAQLGDFKFSPFAMLQSQQGTVNSYSGGFSNGSTSIPAFTTTSYGLDLLYIPWNVTLSSVLQQAADSGGNSGVKTTIFTLSHNF